MTTLNRLPTSGWRYTTTAIWLHWTLALLIVGMVALGWSMMAVEHEPGTKWLFELHKSVGIVVFTLVLVRALWRAGHRPQALPASLPVWQLRLAAGTQWALYACMVALPVTGFIGALYTKTGIAFFSIPLPRLVTPDHPTAELFFSAHSVLVWVLVGFVTLHALAGLKHLLLDRDKVFQRMWF